MTTAPDPSGLDALEVDPAKMRDAVHFRRIFQAVEAGADEAEVSEAVRQARAAGDPWTMVAVALGCTVDEARARYDA